MHSLSICRLSSNINYIYNVQEDKLIRHTVTLTYEMNYSDNIHLMMTEINLNVEINQINNQSWTKKININ